MPSVNTDPTGMVVSQPCGTVFESGSLSNRGRSPQPEERRPASTSIAALAGPLTGLN
jgi:hypothetical protein